MNRNRTLFECVFKEGYIWFPHYVHFNPRSLGMQRRSWIFKQAFPDKESSICTRESWERITQDKIIFIYDEQTKKLTKMENK